MKDSEKQLIETCKKFVKEQLPKEITYTKEDIRNLLQSIGEYDQVTWKRCQNWFKSYKK
jgi:hypothetical protein